jgi:protein phosphatase
MGGGVRGEVASKTAAEAAERYLRDEEWTDPHDGLKAAFARANALVFHEGSDGGWASQSLMGTTLVVALIDEATREAWVANVGDSRAYLAGNHGLSQVTEDHSLVAERVAAGLLTPGEAAEAPGRNMVTRAIGPLESVEADVFGPRRLLAGEILILCSDGLHGAVGAEMILDTVRIYPLAEVPGVLIGAAKDHGGRDNITVVAGGFPAGPLPRAAVSRESTGPVATPPARVWPAPARQRRLFPIVAIAAVIGGLAVVGIGVAALLGGGSEDSSDSENASATRVADDGMQEDDEATPDEGSPETRREPSKSDTLRGEKAIAGDAPEP